MRAGLAALLGLILSPVTARAAEPALYTIAVGFNGVPQGSEALGVEPLRYADDDAASFHRFARDLSRRSYLLTILDADSQRRFPDFAAEARSPTLAVLHEVIDEILAAVQADAVVGRPSSLLFFYSGHGGTIDGTAALTLLDGRLTQAAIYDEVLARVPATFVHVLVDACHAESIVSPRGVQADRVDVGGDVVAKYVHDRTLSRFPHVGAIVATTSNAEAHEWDVFEAGIFTHELLSGLRGGADVNGDGRIEYSELGAFLAAANRQVTDPRARLKTVVHPPALNPRAPLIDLRRARRIGRLRGTPAALGRFFIEDLRGNRIVDLRSEQGAFVDLLVPAAERLFVRNASGEVEIVVPVEATRPLPRRLQTSRGVRARGAVETSLRGGLFAAEFGPAYYRGYVDSTGSVDTTEGGARLAVTDGAAPEAAPGVTTSAGWRRPTGWAAIAVAGVLGVGAMRFGTSAADAHREYQDPNLVERRAAGLRNTYTRDARLAIGLAVGAAVVAAVGVLVWKLRQ
jgi:hypothetical protein